MSAKSVLRKTIRHRTAERKNWPVASTRIPPEESDRLTEIAVALGYKNRAAYILATLRADMAQRDVAA